MVKIIIEILEKLFSFPFLFNIKLYREITRIRKEIEN